MSFDMHSEPRQAREQSHILMEEPPHIYINICTCIIHMKVYSTAPSVLFVRIRGSMVERVTR